MVFSRKPLLSCTPGIRWVHFTLTVAQEAGIFFSLFTSDRPAALGRAHVARIVQRDFQTSRLGFSDAARGLVVQHTGDSEKAFGV